MKNMRPFEIGLIAAFAVAGVVGLIVISNYESPDKESERLYGDSIEVWGTFDSFGIEEILYSLSQQNKALDVVSYRHVDPRTFDEQFVDAIAEGRAPDLVILPHSKLVKHRTKLIALSYETIPERTFRDTYIDGAEIFMRSDGVYGVPLAVDPLVMYWNRDLFSTNGLSQPPKTWSELMYQAVKSITQVDFNRGITRSGVALGEYTNILYAKEILSLLFFQAGSTMVDEIGSSYKVTIDQTSTGYNPGDAVLSFYTQFALSNRELYSWNRAQSMDRFEFLKGDLAIYFAPGSDYTKIEQDNVNLNFDIAPVPQDSNAAIKRTYGEFYALAIPKGSNNQSGAFAFAQLFGSRVAQAFTDAYRLVPVLRVLHSGVQNDPVKSVTYPEALIARGWLDPDPEQSEEVFKKMVEDVTSGRERVSSVLYDVAQRLTNLF